MNLTPDSWDNDYQRRGRLWGGSSVPIPRFPCSSRILELGCGNGKTTAALVRTGCMVTAIDFSSQAASLCKQTCTDPERVRILIADIRKTPFYQESFDIVIAFHVTGHLPRSGRQELAGEVFRLLTPGGTIYFRDFSTGDFRYGCGNETETGTFTRNNGIATHYFTENEVLALFTALTVKSLVQHAWEMRIRGTAFPRAEIVAEFQKPCNPANPAFNSIR